MFTLFYIFVFWKMALMLRGNDFFVYGTKKKNNSYPRIAREIHIEQIHINTTLFHQRGAPVVFIDVQRASKPETIEIGKGHAVLLNVLVEWWNDLGCKIFSNSSEILIFINGGPLKINKGIFRKFADSTGLTTTFCHIPAGIIKWLDMKSVCLKKTINIRQKNNKKCYNVALYAIPKASGTPVNSLKAILSTMANQKTAYISPPEWYYTLKPTSKEDKA